MTNNEINLIKYNIKDILNKYPNTLKIVINKRELKMSMDYDYHDAWNKFIKGFYEWDIININLDEEFRLFYLKRLLQAKKFLKENYKN